MTEQEDRNLDRARQLYALSGAGDWASAAAMLTDDFFVTEAPGLPYEGVYRGRGALEALFNKVMGMMDVTGMDIHGMTAGGEWVIALVDIVALDEEGAELRLSLAEAIRFRGDKVCEIKPYYFDHSLPARAVAAKRAAA